MFPNWVPKVLIPFFIALLLALLGRMAPPRSRMPKHRYDESQAPQQLPTGLIGGTMWCLGIMLALSFFVLRGANRWWASLDGPALLTQYASPFIWGFFPLFAALSIPWPLTIWYLRRVGRWEEADSIEDASNSKAGMDSFRVMKWLSIGLVAPIGFFTLLAIPIHLSIGDSEVRVGHYGSFKSEKFPFKQARRLTIIDGSRMADGSFHMAKDVIVDFADGRRLRGNQVGDGGTSVRPDVLDLLVAKTGLMPEHASTARDIPPLGASR